MDLKKLFLSKIIYLLSTIEIVILLCQTCNHSIQARDPIFVDVLFPLSLWIICCHGQFYDVKGEYFYPEVPQVGTYPTLRLTGRHTSLQVSLSLMATKCQRNVSMVTSSLMMGLQTTTFP